MDLWKKHVHVNNILAHHRPQPGVDYYSSTTLLHYFRVEKSTERAVFDFNFIKFHFREWLLIGKLACVLLLIVKTSVGFPLQCLFLRSQKIKKSLWNRIRKYLSAFDLLQIDFVYTSDHSPFTSYSVDFSLNFSFLFYHVRDYNNCDTSLLDILTKNK